ncbi:MULTISPECIES: hypothetical protein [Sphingobium]|uniref:hypothetical protein n=1 Tax=Sphingobium TaxID=165695 RepID=UPI001BE7CD0A|nr:MULTISPECIES: hypothetical protein [Sphingobium]MBT2246105.1 hypothetical protein [Sphingobium sp. BHU LFT2]WBQ19047.1 hypothetical protein PAE53_24755 [Sphingobium yanoikuyae]
MSVTVESDYILISGHALVEDAEPLLEALSQFPNHRINVSGLIRAHLAVVQLLHAAGRPLTGVEVDGFRANMALASLNQIKDA